MVLLLCALVRVEAVAFSVQVRSRDPVDQLKDEIKKKITKKIQGGAVELQLYPATKDEAWLRSDDEAACQPRNGHVDASIEAMIIAEQMDATWTIKDSLGEDDLKSLAPGKIHILVKLPPRLVQPVKLRRTSFVDE
ncbi:hypothetical protein FI667_g7926, partial [Globisporangium splendens]